MKFYLKIVFSISFFCLLRSGLVYCQEIELQIYPFGHKSYGKSIIEDLNGDLIITGYFREPNSDPADTKIGIVKITQDGDTLWTKRIDRGPNYDAAKKLIETSSGGYFIIGRTSTNSVGHSDLFFVKLNNEGDTIKSWTYGGDHWAFPGDILESTDGYLYISSMVQDSSELHDLWLFKLDINGDTIWLKKHSFDGSINPACITESQNGELTIAGHIYQPELGEDDLMILRLNGDGDTIWTHTSGNPGNDEALSLTNLKDGGLIAVGCVFDSISNYSIPYCCRMDATGAILWEKSIPQTFKNSQFIQIIPYLPDTYLILGVKRDTTGKDYDVWLYQIDAGGTMLSSEVFELPGYQYPQSFLLDSNEEIQICGRFNLVQGADIHMGVMGVPPLRISMIDSVPYVCGSNYGIEPVVSYLGSNPLHYSWSPSNGIDSSNTLIPDVHFSGDQYTYYLSVTDGIFSSIDSVFIQVEEPDYLVNFMVDQQEWTASPFLATFENMTPNPDLYDFTWIFGDGDTVMSNVPSFVHEYLDNGSYDVSLLVMDKLAPCSDLKYEEDYIVCSGGSWPNSIEGINLLEIKLHPNPANSRLTIEFDNPEYEPFKLTIYDNLGKQVMIMDDLSDNQVEINVEKYEPGLHFFRLICAKGLKGSCGKFLIE